VLSEGTRAWHSDGGLSAKSSSLSYPQSGEILQGGLQMAQWRHTIVRPRVPSGVQELIRSVRMFRIVASAEVRTQHILLQHSLGIEELAVYRDGMPHDFQVAIAITAEHRNDHALQFVIE
jgi:hypothetical protein